MFLCSLAFLVVLARISCCPSEETAPRELSFILLCASRTREQVTNLPHKAAEPQQKSEPEPARRPAAANNGWPHKRLQRNLRLHEGSPDKGVRHVPRYD